MRAWWLVLWFVVGGVSAAADPAPAPSTDPVLAEQQRGIEAGGDLGSAAARVLLQARGRQERGDHAGAVQVLGDWLDGHPDREHHLLLFTLAVSHAALERPEPALTALRRAVQLEPRFARAWLRLGETAYGAERYAEAAAAFVRGHELSPQKYPEILYYGGAAWLLADEPARALETLTGLLTDHPGQGPLDWYRALGSAALAAGQPARARPLLDRLLDERPADPAAWELVSRLAAAAEDYRRAAVCLTVAGYLRPLTRPELFQLGDLYSVTGVHLQAARSYRRALALPGQAENSREAEQHERLASAWLAAHQPDQARAALREALGRTPTSRLWALLGDVEYLQEDFTAALEAFGRAADLDAGFGRGWLMMGSCALELGRGEEARRFLERAAEFADQAESARSLLRRL